MTFLLTYLMEENVTRTTPNTDTFYAVKPFMVLLGLLFEFNTSGTSSGVAVMLLVSTGTTI